MTPASENGGQRSDEIEKKETRNRSYRQENRISEQALRIAYSALVRSALPLSTVRLMRQARGQKGAITWFQQKRGIDKSVRPEGSLIWIHTEETSELTSVIALVRRLARSCATSKFLVTTADDPGFDLIDDGDNTEILLKLAPQGQPGWIGRFLDHWQPNGAIFFSSMPNLSYALAARDRNIPLLMINGTMSMKAYRKWRYYPRLIEPALREFSVVLAPTRSEGARLRRLGARNVVVSGSLKYDGQLQAVHRHLPAAFAAAFAGRKIWMAACSTIYETLTAMEVHKALRQSHADVLTIISPAGMTNAEFRAVSAASDLIIAGEDAACGVDDRTDIYLPSSGADFKSLYRLADVVFLGGTEPHQEGEDPIIAASLGAVILHGPHMHRYRKVVSDLQAAGASQVVHDAADLSRTVNRLLATPDLMRQKSIAGRSVAEAETKVVDHIMALMNRELGKITAVR